MANIIMTGAKHKVLRLATTKVVVTFLIIDIVSKPENLINLNEA